MATLNIFVDRLRHAGSSFSSNMFDSMQRGWSHDDKLSSYAWRLDQYALEK